MTGFTVYTSFHCPSAIKHFCLYVTAKLQQTGFSANSIKTHLCVGVRSPASPHLKITSKDRWASPCDKGPYYIPINDTSFELSVFWLSDTEKRINELRFSDSVSLSFKTRLMSVSCFFGEVT